MTVTSVPTRREPPRRCPSRWPVRVRLHKALALLAALVLPAPALAQLPVVRDGADPSVPTVSAPPAPSAAPISPNAAPAPAALIPPHPEAASSPISAISSLPAGMSAQARAGLLELLLNEPTGGKVVVAQLPLTGAKFDTLCSGGFLYIARGTPEVIVLDVRNPRQPRPVASFPVGTAVTALWGGSGSLMVGLSDGATLIYDLSNPALPRYQSLIASPFAPAPPADLGPERWPQKTSVRRVQQSRLATSVRPFLFFANRSPRPTSYGSLIDFSYQYALGNGIWWGIELAPVIINSYYDGVRANSRVWFGYAGDRFAVAGAMGSGVTDDSTWIQFGALARVGRLTGLHATLRLMWSVLASYPYPTSGEFTLESPISRRLGLRYNFTGDSALSGFHTTLGLQLYVGGDHRWRTTVLTPGLGFIYMRTQASSGSSPDVQHPGVIFSFTFEPRW